METRLSNVTQESKALAAAYRGCLRGPLGPAFSVLPEGGRSRRPRSGPLSSSSGDAAAAARATATPASSDSAELWLREPAMNQPDSIQKSRPGLRREALPGSRRRFGFRFPDGQLKTTRESSGRPKRSARDRQRGPPASGVPAWRVGRKLALGPLPPLRHPPFSAGTSPSPVLRARLAPR